LSERRFRPALRGGWVLAAGLLMGPAIIVFGRDPSGRLWPWILMTLVFLGLWLHRLSLVYVLTADSLSAESWWGLGRTETMGLADLAGTEVFRGLAMSVAGCGHVHLRSRRPEGGGLILAAQARAEDLAKELEELARQARGRQRAAGGDTGDGFGTEDGERQSGDWGGFGAEVEDEDQEDPR
jgi:hypothetical protein